MISRPIERRARRSEPAARWIVCMLAALSGVAAFEAAKSTPQPQHDVPQSITVDWNNYPPPPIIQGLGHESLKITTSSPQAQIYFNQGLNLLHCFWFFESYRTFRAAWAHANSDLAEFQEARSYLAAEHTPK